MKKHKCSCCGKIFIEADLVKTKCSENFVGGYFETYCPKCIKKRESLLAILKEIEESEKETERKEQKYLRNRSGV